MTCIALSARSLKILQLHQLQKLLVQSLAPFFKLLLVVIRTKCKSIKKIISSVVKPNSVAQIR